MAKKTKTKKEETEVVAKNLGNLSPAKGSNKNKKRLGRGIGSGLGKTSGKGHKGQKARKGGGIRPGFEGGQMPLYLRLPKRGFTSIFKQKFNIVNLDSLDNFAAGSKVNADTLKAAGLIRDKRLPVKLLGRGELKNKLDISVHKVSDGAKAAVEKSGSSLEVLGYVKRGDPAREKLMKGKKIKLHGKNRKMAAKAK
jgi:large subunit ribosomal protein L15